MRVKIAAYFFVLLYFVALLRPIEPFIEYALKYNYISKVLCINKGKVEMSCKGKCYVMKQLQKQQENDFDALQISIKDYPIGFVNVLDFSTKDELASVFKGYFFYQHNYSYLADFSVFHPPKV